MTRRLFFSFLLSFFFFGLPVSLEAQNNRQVNKGKLVRLIRNQDNTISEFSQSGSERVLIKKTLQENQQGVRDLLTRTVYRKDADLNLRSAKIYDAQGNVLFRVIYGYHKDNGRLVAENMYDCRQKRLDSDGSELAVRAVRYTYDAQGNRARPIVFTSLPGKEASAVFKAGSTKQDGTTFPTELEDNPFR